MTLKEDLVFFNGVCVMLCDLYQVDYPFTSVTGEHVDYYEKKFIEYLSYYKVDDPTVYDENFEHIFF